MVNEIIVAFLGPLHLTRLTLSKPITPEGRNRTDQSTSSWNRRRRGSGAALGPPAGVTLELPVGVALGDGLPLVVLALAAGQAKADRRYPDLGQANAELARYHARQQAALTRLLDETREE